MTPSITFLDTSLRRAALRLVPNLLERLLGHEEQDREIHCVVVGDTLRKEWIYVSNNRPITSRSILAEIDRAQTMAAAGLRLRAALKR